MTGTLLCPPVRNHLICPESQHEGFSEAPLSHPQRLMMVEETKSTLIAVVAAGGCAGLTGAQVIRPERAGRGKLLPFKAFENVLNLKSIISS